MFAKLRASLSSGSRSEKQEKRAKSVERPARQQRRLSKPPTNRTSIVIRFGSKDAGKESSAPASEDKEDAELMDQVSPGISAEARAALRLHLLSPSQSTPSGPVSGYEQANNLISPHYSTFASQPEPTKSPPGSVRPSLEAQRVTSRSSQTHQSSSPTEGETTEWSNPSLQSEGPIQAPSPDDLYFPIRRRSLLSTPGVATRVTRRTFSAESEYSQYSLPEDSIPAPDAFDAFEWRMPTLVERAHTPSDLEFPHLGSYDFGSLRITNGCPSPTASDRTSMHLRHVSVASEPEDLTETPTAAATRAAAMLKSELEVVLAPAAEDTIPVDSGAVDDLVKTERGRPRFRDSVPRLSSSPVASDRIRMTADEYIGELPPSPFEKTLRHTLSPKPSLEVTTKTTEVDDGLFEDERLTASPLELSNIEPATVPQVQVEAADESRPGNPRTSTENSVGKSDSGYSSASSTRSTAEVRKAKFKAYLQTKHSRSKSNPAAERAKPVEKEKEQQKPAAEIKVSAKPRSILPRPPSMPSLPSLVFLRSARANESTQSFASFSSSLSLGSIKRSKSRKLQKRQPPVHSKDTDLVSAQSSDDMSEVVAAGLLSRPNINMSQHIPPVAEPRRSFSRTGGSRRDLSSYNTYDQVRTRLPSPVQEEDLQVRPQTWVGEGTNKHDTSRPSGRSRSRSFFRRSSRGSTSSGLPGECDSATAFAIIQDSENLFTGPGNDNRFSAGRHNQAHRHSFAGPTPSPDAYVRAEMRGRKQVTGMDAETAANLARRRSKVLSEQQEAIANLRRSTSLDRRTLNGRMPRPKSTAFDAPPMPPLPPNLNREWSMNGTDVDGPRPQGFRPTSIPVQGYPSMRPQRQSVSDLRRKFEEASNLRESDVDNPWASITIPPRQSTTFATRPPMSRGIPASHPDLPRYPQQPGGIRPHSSMGSLPYHYVPFNSRAHSTLGVSMPQAHPFPQNPYHHPQTQQQHRERGDNSRFYSQLPPFQHQSQGHRLNVPYRPPLTHSNSLNSHNLRPSSSQNPTVSNSNYYYNQQQQRIAPAPSLRPSSSSAVEPRRPISYSAINSNVSADLVPRIGRYSGGLQYNWDSENKGLMGSAGTRSVSSSGHGFESEDAGRDGHGGARTGNVRRKGVQMSRAFGVDLGDVPVIISVEKVGKGDAMVK